jgi:hypothetical protein
MEPPQPLQQATRILQHMQTGHYLRMLHRRLPYPLFDICRQLGIEYRYFSGQQCAWIILFWHCDDAITAQYCAQIGHEN